MPKKPKGCRCNGNGWFADQRYGADVECVNGVLIDIDVYHDGYPRDVSYPLAPCHPNFKTQEQNDSQERLAEWANIHSEPAQEVPHG